jgi:hypothetical protein
VNPNVVLDAPALAARIDQLLAAHWAGDLVKPAPRADDAEFLRRAYLDLAGRIPPIFEVRDFLDDEAPDKRARLIERLLVAPAFSEHFASVWRAVLLPSTQNPDRPTNVTGFEAWLRKRFQENVGYDRLVHEILTASGNAGETSPAAFYQASEGKPEELAGNTARLFLGLKLECAQCHNHPHASWTRQQFWEYAAFFADSTGRGAGAPQLNIPGTDKTVKARFPDSTTPKWPAGADPRTMLADWTTSAANPYFARTAVNRLWAYFFGLGLVEPVDEAGSLNLPSHPELFDELARQFVAHRFDLRYLIRALTATQAYQRTSSATHPSQDEPRLFARMAIKGLSPEQLFDSLAQATGYREPASSARYGMNGFEMVKTPRSEFLARFSPQEKRTEFHTTILQALHLMNGSFITDATNLERNEVLNTVANATGLDTARRIEELYLNTLSRKPRPDELARLVKYVNDGGTDRNSRQALADVFWALLNSSEFMLNH